MKLEDESYWNLTGDLPPDRVLVWGTEENQPQPLFWSLEPGLGRVFVSIPGHYSWTFDDSLYRILLLRGIAWSAKEPVDRFNRLVWPEQTSPNSLRLPKQLSTHSDFHGSEIVVKRTKPTFSDVTRVRNQGWFRFAVPNGVLIRRGVLDRDRESSRLENRGSGTKLRNLDVFGKGREASQRTNVIATYCGGGRYDAGSKGRENAPLR